jgi:Gas vesicle synthesis protein GvpL/GvpF
MPWYVFALVDRPPVGPLGRGLAGALTARRVPGGFALVERRADVPPVELGTLKQHDAVLARVAGSVPAMLPVRFGTLMGTEEIVEALGEREEELAEAFERVRGRVQFTWRGARGARGAQGARGALTGAEYLRRAAAGGTPPAAFRTIRTALQPLVRGERYQPATHSMPDSLYHLVGRDEQARYRLVAETLAASSSTLRVTGPFPPFAFAPDLL